MSNEIIEEEALKTANEQLRSELEILKKTFKTLDDTINKYSREEEFDSKLELENDLLRDQLLEQQLFFEECQILLQQLTGSTEESIIETKKKELLKQGSEKALNNLFQLTSRSQEKGAWTSIKLQSQLFKTAAPGLNVTAAYRKEPSPIDPQHWTLCLRVDACFPNISPQIVSSGYWSTWISAENWANVFSNFFQNSIFQPHPIIEKVENEVYVSGKSPLPFKFRELMYCKEEDNSEIKINLYREFPALENPRDFIYCMTRVEKDVSMSTLSLSPELTPILAARRDQHTKRIISESETPRRKRNRGSGSNSAAQLHGQQKCWILARSSMRTINADDMLHVESKRIETDDKLVEGLFCWQDYVNIDREINCEEGKVEIKRERVPATRASAFISLTNEHGHTIQETALHNAIVDASDKATERFAKLIDTFYSLMLIEQ